MPTLLDMLIQMFFIAVLLFEHHSLINFTFPHNKRNQFFRHIGIVNFSLPHQPHCIAIIYKNGRDFGFYIIIIVPIIINYYCVNVCFATWQANKHAK